MQGISGLNANYFYGTTSSGVGTLFGSLGAPSGVSSLSSVISDYNSLKTGTYGKLLKAYYGKQTDAAKEAMDSLKSKSKTTDTALKGEMSDVKSAAEGLKKTASGLADSSKLFDKVDITDENGNTKHDYDVDSIYNAVSSFVSDYNKTLKLASGSSNQSIVNGARSMQSTTQVMSKSLQKFGITSDIDGKLTIDESTFKNADMSKASSLFKGTASYAGNIASTASRIMGTASNRLSQATSSTSGYGNSGSYSGGQTGSLFNGYF